MKIRPIEELADMGGVLVHGCFDLLHLGHLRLIDWASSFGPVIVTITSDKYFPNKGEYRPAFPENERAEWLSYIENVRYVSIIHEPTAVTAIRTIKPDVWCKGERVILNIEEIAIQEVGRIEYSPTGHIYSSTKILKGQINDNRLRGLYD